MPTTRKWTLVVVFACAVLAAVWYAISSNELQSSKPIAGKHGQSAGDDHLAASYRALKSVHAGGWYDDALIVGVYGDPDEATEAILDLVENRADVTGESAELLKDWSEQSIASLQRGTYHARIQVLTYLGLTKTKRAEEFLLNAYKNPHDLIPNQKYVQVVKQIRAMDGDEPRSSRFPDGITRRYAFTGLLVLDVEKYSLLLEEDFYAMAPDVEKIRQKENPHETVEDNEFLGRWGVLLDLMGIRDVIRMRGTENPEYLRNQGLLKGDLTKYWNFHTETVVPRQ